MKDETLLKLQELIADVQRAVIETLELSNECTKISKQLQTLID